MSQPAYRTRRSKAFLLRHNADSFHSLHVGLWRDHAYKFFGRDTEALSTLKLERKSSSSTSYSSTSAIFVSVVLVDSLEFVTTDDRLQLLCSDRFLAHHGLVDAEAVFVRPVVTFPLRSLRLTTAAGDAAFAWLRAVVNRGDFRAGLCLGGAASRRLVARKGQVLPLPAPSSSIFLNDPQFDPAFLDDVVAVDCQPIHQGHISLDTDISVVAVPKNLLFRRRGSSSDDDGRPSRGTGAVEDDDVDESVVAKEIRSFALVRPRVIRTAADFRRRLGRIDDIDDGKSSVINQICDDLRKV